MNENEEATQPTITPAEIEAAWRIQKRWEESLDLQDGKSAPERARRDAEDFGKIQDQNFARFAAATITRNLESPAYKLEFERASVELLARVAERNAADEALSEAKEERKARAHGTMSAYGDGAKQPVVVASSGFFVGPVVGVEDGRIAQKAGRDPNELTWHEMSKLQGKVPGVGAIADIRYANGVGQVQERHQAHELGR